MKEITELTAKQENLILAMMSEPTFEKACQKVKISTVTGYNYRKNIVFQKRLREAQNEVMKESTRQLYLYSQNALGVLNEIMLDRKVSPYARVQASKTILEQAYKAYELKDIVEVIEELRLEINEISETNPNA